MSNFNITTILGYSLKKEYVGTMNYRNIITIVAETLHKTTETTAYDSTLTMPNNYEYAKVYQKSSVPITLNGDGFGMGRVISISEPRSVDFDESGLKFWKRIVTIELYEAGDNSNVPNYSANTFYARLKENLFDPRIKEISEDFNFTDDESGNLGYVHTVTVSCADVLTSGSPNDNTETGIYLARQKAQLLVESEVNFGYLGNLANLYGKAGKRTYSTNIDVISGSVTITKTFVSSLIKNPATYSFAVQEDGSIHISESITFKNKDIATRIDLFNGIKSILDNIKADAYARCLGYFNVYKLFITNNQSVDNLQSETISLISVNRSFDERSQEYTQQIIFSNARNLRSAYTLEINQTINSDDRGIVAVSETGVFSSKFKKVNGTAAQFMTSTIKSYIDSEQANSLTRAKNLYNKYNQTNIASPPLKLINSSRRMSSNGKIFGYSVTFNNDPSFIRDGTFNTIRSKITANIPKKIVKTYIVPGYLDNKNVFSQEVDQSTLGSLVINQTSVLKRTDNNKTPDLVNKPSAAINTMYNNCLFALINRLSGFGYGNPNNFIINSVSFSYNSSRSLEMNVGIVYFVASKKYGPQNNLFTI